MDISPARKNIILIGFMGSGKTSSGQVIAARLEFQFVDTDQWIVQNTGLQITELFEKHGEAYFRDQETLALESLRNQTRQVIATGGGIVLRKNNVALLQRLGFVAWLTASEEMIFERVSRNNKRPLMQTENPRETIHQLLTQRNPLYASAAQFTIDTDGRTHEEIADAVIFEAQRSF